MPAIAKNNRPYGGGQFFIDIPSHKVNGGWIKDVDGGHVTGEVITEKLGADRLFKKAVSNIKYEDVTFKMGAGMSSGAYEWIQHSFDSQCNVQGKGRADGAIVCGDFDYNEVSRIDFVHALVTEYGMPALDASSKDGAAITVKFTPEKTTYKTGGGNKFVNSKAVKPTQKLWTCANFDMTIDGIPEDILGNITKVDALTIKQKVVQHYTGKHRDYQIEPTSVEIPNLVVTIAESYAKPFMDWHEDFVIKGNCGDKNEKTGSLVYLSQSTTREELFTLNFSQLGIFKVTPEKVEVGDKIRYVKVEMYCENIKFQFGKGKW